MGIVEAAKHKTLGGQTDFRSSRRLLRNQSRRVHLIALRQVNDTFAVESLLVEGQNDRIGNDVVDELSTESAWSNEIVHLEGRRSVRENSRARTGQICTQIDDNVDFGAFDQHGGFAIRARRYVVKMIER